VDAMYEDLLWLGIAWQEGPYSQSERREVYVDAWGKLRDARVIYPCTCSRKDLAQAAGAPHEDPHEDDADEVPYPGTCRGKSWNASDFPSPAGVSWRFRVPDGEVICFHDALAGPQEF